MEEKKSIKISVGMLVCLIIIALLVMIIIGFGVYVYFLKNDKVEMSQPISNVENVPNEETEEVKKSIKVDDTKDYVYEKDRTEVNETIDYGGGITDNFTDTITLPFINIDSEDAKKINESLQQEYDKASTSLQKVEYGFDYTEMRYEYTIFEEKVLSLKILEMPIVVPGGCFPEYYDIYHIDLETGKQLSKEEMLRILNVNEETIQDKAVLNLAKYLPIDEYGFETVEDIYNSCDLDNYQLFVKDKDNIEVYLPHGLMQEYSETEKLSSIVANIEI